MQRRRGLVTQVKKASTEHAGEKKRERSASDSEMSEASSESSGLSSGLSEIEAEVKKHENITTTDSKIPEDALSEPESPRSKLLRSKKGPKAKKEKVEMSEEERWQKMKIKGSDKEIMVDMSRVQKYIDLDNAGLQSFKEEVQQVKGNFRQQLADYSDL
jgi:hypothetical protein